MSRIREAVGACKMFEASACKRRGVLLMFLVVGLLIFSSVQVFAMKSNSADLECRIGGWIDSVASEDCGTSECAAKPLVVRIGSVSPSGSGAYETAAAKEACTKLFPPGSLQKMGLALPLRATAGTFEKGMALKAVATYDGTIISYELGVDPDIVGTIVGNESLLLQMLNDLKDDYNANIDKVPSAAIWLFGDEYVTLNVDDQPKASVKFEKGLIKEITPGSSDKRTLDVYVSSDTITQMVVGKKSFSEALKDGSISYKATTFFGKIKFAILGWLAGIAK